jgi:hypothetical protein
VKSWHRHRDGIDVKLPDGDQPLPVEDYFPIAPGMTAYQLIKEWRARSAFSSGTTLTATWCCRAAAPAGAPAQPLSRGRTSKSAMRFTQSTSASRAMSWQPRSLIKWPFPWTMCHQKGLFRGTAQPGFALWCVWPAPRRISISGKTSPQFARCTASAQSGRGDPVAMRLFHIGGRQWQELRPRGDWPQITEIPDRDVADQVVASGPILGDPPRVPARGRLKAHHIVELRAEPSADAILGDAGGKPQIVIAAALRCGCGEPAQPVDGIKRELIPGATTARPARRGNRQASARASFAAAPGRSRAGCNCFAVQGEATSRGGYRRGSAILRVAGLYPE